MCSLAPFLPESPRYLCARDQTEQGLYNLAALRGGHLDAPDVVEEINEIKYAIAIENREAGSWSDCFRDGGIGGWQRVAIAFAANFFQQLSGVNVISSLGRKLPLSPGPIGSFSNYGL